MSQENWTWTPQIMWINTQKVIWSVKLHISHQMKLYSNVETISGMIYIYFSVFGTFREIEEIGPKYHKSWACIYRESSEVFNCRFCIKWNLTQVQRPSEGWVIPVLVYLDITASHGNWIQKTQIKGTNTQIVIQSAKLHISHQMMPCSGAKTVWKKFIPALVFLWHWSKSGKLDPNTSNREQRYTESHRKC